MGGGSALAPSSLRQIHRRVQYYIASARERDVKTESTPRNTPHRVYGNKKIKKKKNARFSRAPQTPRYSFRSTSTAQINSEN